MQQNQTKSSLSIQKLNQAYIRLIKMVLNGNFTPNSPFVNSFYHDPSPDQAYSILSRIFNQDNTSRNNQGGYQYNNNSNSNTVNAVNQNTNNSTNTNTNINNVNTGTYNSNNNNNYQDYTGSTGVTKKFGVRRAMTTGTDQREYINSKEDIKQGIADTRANGDRNPAVRTYAATDNTTSITKVNQPSMQPKMDKLKRLTARITQIFSNNHRKILKYQEISKYSAPSDSKFAKPTEIAFRKY